MAMIQGIDGSALINAFRAGRSDRYANEDRLRTQQKEDRDTARQEQFSGLVGQLFGERQPATVASNYAPPAPVAAPQTFGEAFAPEGIAAAGPQAAPIPQMPAQAPSRQPNPDVMAQLILLDPERAGQIATALKSMDEMGLKRAEARNNFMGAAARYVAQGKTPQERLQRFQIASPQLLEAGYTPEELDGIDNDLSDERLQFYMATAIDYDKIIDNELAEREFRAGKTVPVTAGGSVANVRPTLDAQGNVTGTEAEYIIGGGNGEAPVRVASIEEARNLPPGTRFIDPNGVERIVPGGPTPQASAPFPG